MRIAASCAHCVQSLYIGGARRFDSNSTVHAANVTGWMRPAEFCDDVPVLCAPERGYDIYQLKQVRYSDNLLSASLLL